MDKEYSYSGFHQSSKEDNDPILEYQEIDTRNIEKQKYPLVTIPFFNATSAELIAYTTRTLEEIKNSSRKKPALHIMPVDPFIFFTLRHHKKSGVLAKNSFINLPAGRGIQWIAGLFKKPLPEEIPASLFVLNLIRMAQAKNYTLFIVGSDNQVLEKLHSNFLRSFPKLRITGKHHGYLKGEAKEKVLAAMQKTAPDIILLSLGYKKEMQWISENKKHLKNCIIINLNGALDNMAGKKKSAPNFINERHLVWFWRSINRPHRWYRLPYLFFCYLELLVLRVFKAKLYARPPK